MKNHNLSWQTIPYHEKLPETFLIPEHHWPDLQKSALNLDQRIRLNHLLTYFLCEMFVFFETAIIDYMKYNQKLIQTYLTQTQIERFIQEEIDHSNSFLKFAQKIRPDIYVSEELRYLKQNQLDKIIVRHTPISSFFLMAALFEEMTVFVKDVMKEKMDESWSPFLDAMQLHAIEEKGHIGLDRKIVDGANQTRSWIRIQIEMTTLLPLVFYVDKKISFAWRLAAKEFAVQEKLSTQILKQIYKKGTSKSDILGIQSFLKKLEKKPALGSMPLCYALSKI